MCAAAIVICFDAHAPLRVLARCAAAGGCFWPHWARMLHPCVTHSVAQVHLIFAFNLLSLMPCDARKAARLQTTCSSTRTHAATAPRQPPEVRSPSGLTRMQDNPHCKTAGQHSQPIARLPRCLAHSPCKIGSSLHSHLRKPLRHRCCWRAPKNARPLGRQHLLTCLQRAHAN